jgi:HEXXH motif-containing protein
LTGRRAAPTHTVAFHDFQALASGGGDHQVVTTLRGSERSWRLMAMRALVDAAAAHPVASGPLPSVETAWQLLIRAHLAAPADTEDVLTRPQVGVWLAHTLRRLVGEPVDAVPLWVDLGYLHALAAAAATRAGLTFELDMPARHGQAVLPTVGAATLPAQMSLVRVVAHNGAVAIIGDGGRRTRPGEDRWHAPIQLIASADGIDLRLDLLDRDVYRDLRGPAPPTPVTADQVRRWRALLDQAWKLLVREQPDRARTIATTLSALAPLPARERFRQLSASGAEAFGVVLLSEPDDATQLAMTLVHESQHHKLGALTHLLTLVHDAPSRRFYAPWRDDPRPAAGLLQGAYAFAGITDFWRIHRRHAPTDEAELADFEFALWRRQTRHALRALLSSDQLTGHGKRFVEVLHSVVAAYQAEPVRTAAQTLADRAAADHRALWRAHNLRIGAGGAALAAAWTGGRPFPTWLLDEAAAQPGALPRPDRARFDARAVLTRHRLADPAGFRRLCSEPETVGTRVAGATAADLALVAGDVERARTGYLRQVAQDLAAGEVVAHSWVGLALTWPAGPPGPAARALLHRPELVMELLRQLAAGDGPPQVGRRTLAAAAPDPVALAGWVGTDLAGASTRRSDPVSWPVVGTAEDR